MVVSLAAIPLAAASHLISRTTPAKALLGIVMIVTVTKPTEHYELDGCGRRLAAGAETRPFGLGLGVLPRRSRCLAKLAEHA